MMTMMTKMIVFMMLAFEMMMRKIMHFMIICFFIEVGKNKSRFIMIY